MEQLTRADFEHLLEFRSSLRRFQRWSEDQARAAGLTHVQHQLLVAIMDHHGSGSPTVSELADCLLLRHHSMVELVNRAEAAGFVRRSADPREGRLVLRHTLAYRDGLGGARGPQQPCHGGLR